jgi:hypothetical protein
MNGEIIMIQSLQNPHTVAYYAAQYEAQQAGQDYTAAFAAYVNTSYPRAGSPEDYAVWSAGGYADAADRVVRDLPVWEA